MGEFSLELLPSLGLVLLFGLIFGAITEKIGLPSLVGYLLAGVLLGGSGLSLVGESLREVSPDLREMALLMILLKAGLNLAWESLRKVGRPALLLSFCPASFEILSCLVFAPLLFSLNLMESALLGSVLAAVSPAVVVPRMVRFMEKGVGKKSHAPEIVLAGASLDDVFVILLFSSLLSILMGGDFSYLSLLELPISIISGVVVGFLLGKSLSRWRKPRNQWRAEGFASVRDFLLSTWYRRLCTVFPLVGRDGACYEFG
ncbi:MAG: cation:proton antiporter [Eubacteriales bacterium]